MNRKVVMFLLVPLGAVGFLSLTAGLFGGAGLRYVIPLVTLGPVVVGVSIHGFTLPEDYMKRWTKAHAVDVDDENRPVIRRYLLRGRRFRTVGALAGFLTYSIWVVWVADDSIRVSWITATFAGYLLGAAAAEILVFRPERGAVRVASLAPRRVGDYVPRWPIVLIIAATLASVALAACWSAIPTRPELRDFSMFRPDPWPIVAWAGVAVALAILVTATARRIVRRPQPVTTEEMVAVDDAIRSTAMHGLMGAGLSLVLGILARNASDWSGYVGPERLNGLFQGISILGGLFSLVVWLRLGIDQPWVVRRSRPQEQAAS